jgi:preprotein translocase subunit SecE
MKFLSEVKMELKRTTWPGRREVQNTTVVVVITVFIFAAFLGVVDLALGNLLRRVLQFFAQ